MLYRKVPVVPHIIHHSPQSRLLLSNILILTQTVAVEKYWGSRHSPSFGILKTTKNVLETVSAMLCLLVFRILDDGQSPEPCNSVLYTMAVEFIVHPMIVE
jgi:hypothetical protein